MNWENIFITMPVFGWICILFIIAIVALTIFEVFRLLEKKEIKLKNIELVSKSQKELYKTEGSNLLENQNANAHNLLKKVWIDIYETGRKIFAITDTQELFLLEDISKLIEAKLNYEVRKDLARNHISTKESIELNRYSDAKAEGYYRMVKANLYAYNVQLPKYELPSILNHISVEDFKKIFEDIYFSARKIAGGQKEGGKT